MSDETAKHVGIQPGILYPQPDYEADIDDQGKWTVSQLYLCHKRSLVELRPKTRSVHPDLEFCFLKNCKIKIVPGDIAEIHTIYTGIDPDDDGDQQDEQNDPPPQARYSIGIQLNEEPILAHSNYNQIPQAEAEALVAIINGKEADKDGNAYRPLVVSTEGLAALAKIDRGTTQYYSPKITWRASWTSTNRLSANILNYIGKIMTPKGSPPALAQGRTWLLNTVDEEEEGEVVNIQMEWLASDVGGWDPDLYTKQP